MKEGDFCNKNVKIMNILIVITDVCKDPNTLRTIKFIYDAIKILYYIIPIILIVMITLDVAKNVVATDSEIGKNTSLIVKRIIAVILLFLVPNIVSFVLNIVETPKENINETFESCLANIEDIPHWEKVYERLKEDDDKRFKEEYLSRPYTLSIQRAKRQIFSSSDTGGNTTGGGIVHGFESLATFTIDSSMNLLLLPPITSHVINFSGQISTAPLGIVGLNFKSFAYSFSR